MNHAQPPRLLKMKDLLMQVPLSRSQVYKLIAEGSFPAQINLSGRAVAWRQEDVDAWIASRERTIVPSLLQLQRARTMQRALNRVKQNF